MMTCPGAGALLRQTALLDTALPLGRPFGPRAQAASEEREKKNQMYAIVRIGGRQYPVEVGETVVVEKLPYEVGESVEFDEILYVGGDEPVIGQPLVDGASVKAEVVEQFKGKKIVVFKYKPKVRYRRKYGHRQHYTRLRVDDITTG
jgi:large subunit ribosomal protein L21